MKKVEYYIGNSLVFLFVFSIAQTFLSMSSFNRATPIILFILVVMLLLQHSKSNIIKGAGIFIAQLIMMYVYLQQGESFFKWLTTLVEQTQESISFVFVSSIAILPNTLGVMLVGLFIILMLVLTMTFKQWKVAFIIQLAYYLLLIGLNQVRVTNHILMFAFASMLLAAWQILQQTNTEKRAIQTIVVLTGVVSLIVVGSYQIPNSFPITYQNIQTQTIELRRELSDSLFRTLERLGDSTGLTLQSGFSENDSYLGGPMTTSKRIVYETIQSQPTYWRIESKEIYTSKGWETRTMPNQMVRSPFNVDFNFENYSSQTETIRFTTSRDNITFIPIPYGNVTVSFSDSFYRLNSTYYESENHRIRTDNLREDELVDVVIQYQRPIYYEQQLIDSRATSLNPANPYIQLPDTLPQRVVDLAFSITEGATNDYEKVKMIENYLTNPTNFSYTLSNAEFVPYNRDYVDFFLFDTQRGYCEHFSSAMTIMLRALNIQARWVKGYSPGEEITAQFSDKREFQIIEANAHAWVEVFFENVGWIPFEPTPSFSFNHESPSTPINENNNTSENNDPNGPTNPNDPSNPDEIPFEDEAGNLPDAGRPTQGDEDGLNFDSTLPSPLASDNFFWIIFASLLLVVGSIMYYLRAYLSLLMIQARFKKETPTSLKEFVSYLYKALEHTQDKKQSDTYLEYVASLNWLTSQQQLIKLSKQTDAIFYGNQPDTVVNKEHEDLFNSIMSQCIDKVKKQRIEQLDPRPLLQSSGLIRYRKY